MSLNQRIVEALLSEAPVGARAITGVVGELNHASSPTDRSVAGRIARQRARTMARDLRDRDGQALERAMVELDRAESAAETRNPAEAMPTDFAVRYIGELPETWRKAAPAASFWRAPCSTESTFSGSRRRPST